MSEGGKGGCGEAGGVGDDGGNGDGIQQGGLGQYCPVAPQAVYQGGEGCGDGGLDVGSGDGWTPEECQCVDDGWVTA